MSPEVDVQCADESEQKDDQHIGNTTFKHGRHNMPSKSQKQNRFMHAAAKNPKMAKRMGVPQKVAKDFVKADAGRKIKRLPMHAHKTKRK